MKKSWHLFFLIHSLSANEKRYFRMLCRESQTHSNYLRLFEAILEQESYDEAAIRARFEGETFLNQLHVTKGYLRDLILKSLRNFHSQHSQEIRVRNLLIHVELLFDRELYELAESELTKALKIARKYELATALVEIQSWQRKLTQQAHPHAYESLLKEVEAQEAAIAMLAQLNEAWRLTLTMARPDVRVQPEFWDTPALNTKAKSQSLETQVVLTHLRYSLHLRSGGMEEATDCFRELIEVLEAHPHRIRESPSMYLASLNNLMGLLVYRKQYEEALQYRARGREAPERFHLAGNDRNLIKSILRGYNIELEIYRDRHQFDKITPLKSEIDQYLQDHHAHIPVGYLLSFWFQFAYIAFLQRAFEEALSWINRILNQKAENIRLDLQIHARMLNLMVHVELHNFFVLRYYVDSTRRFLKRKRKLIGYEQKLLAFFSRIGRIPIADFPDVFQHLYDQLGFASSPLIPPNVLDYIDFESWISSKLPR